MIALPTDPTDLHNSVIGELVSVARLTPVQRQDLNRIVSEGDMPPGRKKRLHAGIKDRMGWSVLVGEMPTSYFPGVSLVGDAVRIDPPFVAPAFERRGQKCLAIPNMAIVALLMIPVGMPYRVMASPFAREEDDASYFNFDFECCSGTSCAETGRPMLILPPEAVARIAAGMLACAHKGVARTIGTRGEMRIGLAKIGTIFTPHHIDVLNDLKDGKVFVVGGPQTAPYTFVRSKLEC